MDSETDPACPQEACGPHGTGTEGGGVIRGSAELRARPASRRPPYVYGHTEAARETTGWTLIDNIVHKLKNTFRSWRDDSG